MNNGWVIESPNCTANAKFGAYWKIVVSVTTLGSIKTSFHALQHTQRSVANDRN